MEIPAWVWIAFTVAGGATQTVRNALQRSLTAQLGTLGATHVRFLFGLPFALLFLAGFAGVTGLQGAQTSPESLAWTLMGALCQIAATALMLATMRQRAFVVAIAYVKTEPVQIALFAFVILGETLTLRAVLAIVIATLGVLLMSWPKASAAPTPSSPAPWWQRQQAAGLGIASGALFALSAVGFRGGIVALGDGPFYVRASLTLCTALVFQTTLLTLWLQWRSPEVLRDIFRAWRPSLLAGASGALASQFWFLAFSLQGAAAVRTVGLIELLFAQIASRTLFSQHMTGREGLGIALMVAGLIALTWS